MITVMNSVITINDKNDYNNRFIWLGFSRSIFEHGDAMFQCLKNFGSKWCKNK